MKRLDIKTKKEIKKLIKKGESLNQIKSKTGIEKTTIYYYMRKIVGRKIIQIKINRTSNERIGEIIGFFAGDGYFAYDKKRWDRRAKFYFNRYEEPLVNYYKKSIKNLINKPPHEYHLPSVIILEVRSKEFISFILEYLSWRGKKGKTVGIKNKDILKNKDFVRGFLRGLIDSDGYVRKARREIYFGSISNNLINNFTLCLGLFGFKYKIYTQKREKCSDFFKVRLTGSEVDRFIRLIMPIKRL